MGYKNVCLNCRTAFSTGMDYYEIRISKCTSCEEMMTLVNHKFRPPKKSDTSGWKLVKLLMDNGFRFDAVYKNYQRMPYPNTLEQAEEFLKTYKSRSVYK
jgi:hypothetical protein